ncbi:MAG: hypothetical protein ACU0BB_03065 [Paracoccaceae bacterium]
MTIQKEIPQPKPEHGLLQSGISTPDYDSETAVLMRCALRPVFEQARSWDALNETMRQRGYTMCFRGGHLCLIRQVDGTRICGLRFLGLDLHELVARLGRPVVVLRHGGHADGELLVPSAPALAVH